MSVTASLSAAPLRCAFLQAEAFAGLHAADAHRGFGATLFSLEPGQFAPESLVGQHAPQPPMPLLHVPTAVLAPDGSESGMCELWQIEGEITRGVLHSVQYSHNRELLFGAIQVDESDFDGAEACEPGKTPLQQAAEHAYCQIFRLLDALDFPHVLRFWNYLADINGHSHGMERYRQFNIGRQDGFIEGGRGVLGSVPAASAVGFRDGPLTVNFFAARTITPLAIENPRQISAYDYPDAYGPRSPTFSRANIVPIGGSNLLLVSGTASIVGHATLHAGDVVQQTRESLVNIAAILEEARRVLPHTSFAMQTLCYKIYVRHAQDVAAIHDEMRRTLGATPHLLFLEADICRDDLLMEIEATAGHPVEFSATATASGPQGMRTAPK